jgi:hypothetical protein
VDYKLYVGMLAELGPFSGIMKDSGQEDRGVPGSKAPARTPEVYII